MSLLLENPLLLALVFFLLGIGVGVVLGSILMDKRGRAAKFHGGRSTGEDI